MLTRILYMDGREKDLKHSGVAKPEMLKVTLKSLHFTFLSVTVLGASTPLWMLRGRIKWDIPSSCRAEVGNANTRCSQQAAPVWQ